VSTSLQYLVDHLQMSSQSRRYVAHLCRWMRMQAPQHLRYCYLDWFITWGTSYLVDCLPSRWTKMQAPSYFYYCYLDWFVHLCRWMSELTAYVDNLLHEDLPGSTQLHVPGMYLYLYRAAVLCSMQYCTKAV